VQYLTSTTTTTITTTHVHQQRYNLYLEERRCCR